jgi:hypothetical protein
MRDDTKLYLGTDGDFRLWYDSTYTAAAASGADLRISDTQKIEFGDGGDASLNWDGHKLVLTSTSDIKLTTSFITLGVSGRQALSDSIYFKSDTAGGGYFVMVSSG